MISKMEINGVHTKVSDDLKKYITKKIGKLDRFMSRHVRESAHAEVMIKESKAKDKKQHTCEVILHLPHDTVTTKETTMNIFAAVDIVETKLKNQLKKYKDKHGTRTAMHRLVKKIGSRKTR